ncbi:agmatinase [Desulfocicer vacuolatum DSM 3385]|uniref:Agmatinase n=1 Tax=Desulfocicer vacuolatum DSM 3385 TaxID=1121400 RepID=A0A1W2E5W9_9BACT|nr:agmatinase [Desulfocicer vacuolatum]SMD05170.1 agmatinase [Desulfocicer vacuolatum DSM 3385]
MNNTPDFIDSELTIRDEKRSRFHVIPIPMETSVSYGGGTARGPRAILDASQQLEAWDGRSLPVEWGIYTTPPVVCKGSVEQILDRIKQSVTRTLSFNALPVILGGEHTVTLGALQALKKSGSPSFGIVQIDAHADLRESYEGSPLSHACVMRRATQDLGIPLVQIGVRALCREEEQFRQEQNISFFDARDLHLLGMPEQLFPPDFPDHIYITLDVDGLDPSVIRATGTPVPGGISWHDTLTLLEKSISGKKVLGFDVVELAPVPGDHASDFAAAQLVYSTMGIIQRKGI